jgi:hypothetical protein
MNASMDIYQYQPIEADKEIRVLRLEPATSFTAPLIAALFVRELEDDPGWPAPRYACVSYCWGIPTYDASLTCNGYTLQVTAVVDEMLRHLRQSTKSRNLWVDAICINQSRDEEKARQVQLMGSIYERADKVHIWLGSASDEDHIPVVFALLRKHALSKQASLEIKWSDQEEAFNEEQESSQDEELTMSDRAVNCLEAFFTRPWFTRRWVSHGCKGCTQDKV